MIYMAQTSTKIATDINAACSFASHFTTIKDLFYSFKNKPVFLLLFKFHYSWHKSVQTTRNLKKNTYLKWQ